jgi:elongation factor G
VEVGTDLVWEHMQRYDRPVIIGVNQLDHANADFDATVAQAKEHFGPAVTVMQYPVEQGDGFHRIIDLLKMTMYVFKDAGGKPEKAAHPRQREGTRRSAAQGTGGESRRERRDLDGALLRQG